MRDCERVAAFFCAMRIRISPAKAIEQVYFLVGPACKMMKQFHFGPKSRQFACLCKLRQKRVLRKRYYTFTASSISTHQDTSAGDASERIFTLERHCHVALDNKHLVAICPFKSRKTSIFIKEEDVSLCLLPAVGQNFSPGGNIKCGAFQEPSNVVQVHWQSK